jgi:hypothetical protein
MSLTKHGHVCEKIFNYEFWVSEKLGCYSAPAPWLVPSHTVFTGGLLGGPGPLQRWCFDPVVKFGWALLWFCLNTPS